MAGFTNLGDLWLQNNEISDISALVANIDLGAGDYVYVTGNPLNKSSLCDDILALEARGVHIEWTENPAIECPEPSVVLLQLAALATLSMITRQKSSASF